MRSSISPLPLPKIAMSMNELKWIVDEWFSRAWTWCWIRSPWLTITGVVLLFGLFALALTYALPILIGILVGVILIGGAVVLLVAILRVISRR